MREGWVVTTLAEIAEVNPEGVEDIDVASAITYVDIASVVPGVGIATSLTNRIRMSEAPGRARRRIRADDVLVSTVRPYLKAFAQVPSDLDGEVASTGFAVLRATTHVLPGMIWNFVSTTQFVDTMMQRATGSNYPAVRPADVASFRVALPPLPEQHRIVDLMNAADAYVAAADARVAAARAARTALLTDLLSTPGEDWVETTLDTVCEMQLGKMLSKERASGPNQAPYLRNASVQAGRLILDDLKSMTFTDADRERYCLRSGDILVCEGGDPGRAVLLERNLDGIFFQKTLHRLRATDIDPRFLYLTVCRAYDDGRIADLCTNTTIKHLTAEKFKRLRVVVPPDKRQAEIVDLMSAAYTDLQLASGAADAARTFRSALLADLLSGTHEIPASYDRFLEAA